MSTTINQKVINLEQYLLKMRHIYAPTAVNLLIKNCDTDIEIRHHQLSSPASPSCCPVTQMSPSMFVAVAVARAVAVAVAVAVVVAVLVVVAMAVAVVAMLWRWQ